MYPFIIGNLYSRKDIYRMIGIDENTRGGNWDTGYNKFNNDFFVFVNIGTAGRTGIDYANSFDENDKTVLHWFAKNNTHIGQPLIKEMLNPTGYLYVFTREDSNNPKFTFSGFAKAIDHLDTMPVQITWKLGKE